jgi:hypothetical protein
MFHLFASTVNTGGEYMRTKGDKKLTITIAGCRMRDYVSVLSITIQNKNEVVQVGICAEKHENLFNQKLSQKHAT